MNFRASPPITRPALKPSPSVVDIDESPPSSSECACVDSCFGCDTDYKWYDLKGKGKFFKPIGSLKKTRCVHPSLIKLVWVTSLH